MLKRRDIPRHLFRGSYIRYYFLPTDRTLYEYLGWMRAVNVPNMNRKPNARPLHFCKPGPAGVHKKGPGHVKIFNYERRRRGSRHV